MIFFENKTLNKEGTLICFTATEGDIILGNCVLSLERDYAEVVDITMTNDSNIIAEGLIKSAFNYAANKNFYMGRCCIENIYGLLQRMNFVRTQNGFENDIPSILMGKCVCCGK